MSWGRIVVVRLTALGDSLLAAPALRALKEAHPEARLTFVTGAPQAPLFEGLPYVDEVAPLVRTEPLGAFAARVRGADPIDLFVDLQHKARTALLGTLLHPRRRVAFRRRDLVGGLRALVGRDTVLAGRHAVGLYLDALAPAGVEPPPGDGARPVELVVPDVARSAAAARLGPEGGAPWVAVAPGARWASKRWPPERFAEVARRLAEGRGVRIVLVGGPDDAPAAAAFEAALGRPPDAQTLDLALPEVAAVLDRCALLVAGDTGPAHLAAGLGVPVVSLFGPTAPSRWAPTSPGSRVVSVPIACAPCTNHGGPACPLGHHRCMLDLDSGRVASEALAVLDAVLDRQVGQGTGGSA